MQSAEHGLREILTKTQDLDGLWVVRVKLAEDQSILLICVENPVDEEAFFEELDEYLQTSPDQLNFLPSDTNAFEDGLDKEP